MKKYSAMLLLMTASISSVSAWARPMSSEDIENLDNATHKLEKTLFNLGNANYSVKEPVKQSVCESINQLNNLGNDLIMEKSVPDETSRISLRKLIEFSQATEKLLNYCDAASSQHVTRYALSQGSLQLMRTEVYPALTAFEKTFSYSIKTASRN